VPGTGEGQPSPAPKEITGRLFQPATDPRNLPKDKSTQGAASGDRDGPLGGSATRLGQTGRVPDFENIKEPVERDAALKLQQAVQRIKANRERRGNPVRGGSGSPVNETRRDW
jgi:hypothetical protein